jgi:uncharacterized protein
MAARKLSLSVLRDSYGICRLSPEDKAPDWARCGEFWSVTRNSEEMSVVCAEADIPETVKSDRGWRCLKVYGPLDFSLTGILVSLARPLADAGISVFALSTYDTDYLLVKEEKLDRALAVLAENGHKILNRK